MLVLLAGIARNYDQSYFFSTPIWLIGPLAFSCFSGSFLYAILIRGIAKRHFPENRRAQRSRHQRLAVLLLVLGIATGTVLVEGGRVRVIMRDTVASYLDPAVPTAARTLLYITGWRIARERFPLGSGFGRFGGYVSQLYYSPLYDQYGLSAVYGLSRDFPVYISDTYWPHILGEAGVLGALFFAALLLRMWHSCVRVARRASSESVKVLAMIAAMLLIEAVLESVVAPIFDNALQAYIIAIPVGVTLVLGAPEGPELPRPNSGVPPQSAKGRLLRPERHPEGGRS